MVKLLFLGIVVTNKMLVIGQECWLLLNYNLAIKTGFKYSQKMKLTDVM